MKNKVLFILGDGVYPHKTGGMEVFNYYLIRELRPYFDIRYKSCDKLNFEGIKHHRIFNIRPVKYVFPLQIFWHYLTHPSENTVIISFSSAHWFIWWMYGIMTHLFKKNSITVIHYGKSVPQTCQFAYKKFFNSQKAVVAVSEDIKQNYDKAFETDCIVLPPMVPFEESTLSKEECRAKYRIPQNANVISMVGSIKGMKNPGTIIEAISSMSEEEIALYKPYALFAGGGDMIEELKEKATELGIANRVKFLGNVPKDDVSDVMKASDVYLIASDFEGTSVSLLEAMYNKKKIISSRAPGICDMVRENIDALMFDIKDFKQLKHAIISTLANPEEAESRANSAYDHYCNMYSYENMIRTYVELLS